MTDIPEDDLEETRAALAPTLDAAAAILPWVAKPRAPRFDPKVNERWVAAGKRLATAWSERHGIGADDVRPAVFGLYAIALETADTGCLRLGEALASAADRLEETSPSPRLIAAISGAIECLSEPDGLEHDAFADRAQHFATRLESLVSTVDTGERSAILDRLFVDEACEQLETMRDALAALPPDAYALTTEAMKLAQQAELLELWGITHLAQQLSDFIGQHATELDTTASHEAIEKLLHTLGSAIAAIDAAT